MGSRAVDSHKYDIVTSLEQPEYRDVVGEISERIWPEFMFHDPVADDHWDGLYEKFAAFQFAMLDREQGVIAGFANSVPLRWDGTLQDLPDDGWDWALNVSASQYAKDVAANMLCGIQISVSPEYQGQGLSSVLLREMAALARRRGLSQVIVPVRPSMKSRYPLTPMIHYIKWHREDGLPYDPWLRVHVRSGGTIVKPCHTAMRISGTIAAWEEWTGMRFFESGDYVVPDALTPVRMDIENDVGLYIEPNVWVDHQVDPKSA